MVQTDAIENQQTSSGASTTRRDAGARGRRQDRGHGGQDSVIFRSQNNEGGPNRGKRENHSRAKGRKFGQTIEAGLQFSCSIRLFEASPQEIGKDSGGIVERHLLEVKRKTEEYATQDAVAIKRPIQRHIMEGPQCQPQRYRIILKMSMIDQNQTGLG